jgi:tetratricopeptide (TPR) repeat protein
MGYILTKDEKELARAKNFALKAASSDPNFDESLYLLLNIGIAYLNSGEQYEAERIGRYIVSLRPESFYAWYSWGLALRIMGLDEDAIVCFDKIIDSYRFDKKGGHRYIYFSEHHEGRISSPFEPL